MPLTTMDIYKFALTGNNTYRARDIQRALRMLENEGKLKRITAVSKRVKNFKDDELFKMIYNQNNHHE